MFKIGTYQMLNVARRSEHGYFLQNTSTPNAGEVLLPSKLASRNLQEGENVRVFLYKDGEERLTATMQDPKVTLNSIALLTVKETTYHGAYLDWGLDKDLFIPFSEPDLHVPGSQDEPAGCNYQD